ncbi:hypothetical protein B0F90DRAFT_1824127 [Multifurca ochricompacta]|uniref:Crinkler effector protein N-terminal domain-containing protein n=1 Tax=Multifurca ochricompacta TaxID=376703 RepID=A0AAD4LX90_9AGAM|nr:hypothetical protein B0F90DRAFT_1824127 [Multifurca ochricompacta]
MGGWRLINYLTVTVYNACVSLTQDSHHATVLTLFCLAIAIDNQKDPIRDIFKLKIQLDDNASDIKDIIKAKMVPRLDHLLANELIIWKLLTPLHIDLEGSTISAVKNTIGAIDFPSAESDTALRGNGTVQVLYPSTRLSRYWDDSPNEDHLHVIVQIPSVQRPEKRRRLDNNREYNIEQVFETAKDLHSTLWKTLFASTKWSKHPMSQSWEKASTICPGTLFPTCD